MLPINCDHLFPALERLPMSGKVDILSKKIRTLDNVTYCSKSYLRANGVNLTSNELKTQETYSVLSESQASKQSCHIGVSGWYNLDVMAARKTERGIVFDSNPEVALFFDHTFACIKECASRDEFLQQIKVRLATFDTNSLDLSSSERKHSYRIAANIVHEDVDDLSPENEIDFHAKQPCGWLANEASYEFIRRLVLLDRIAVITADITHKETFQKIHRLLDDNSIHVDTLYVSNVADYIDDKLKPAFIGSISNLTNDGTLLINAEFEDLSQALEQKISVVKQNASQEELLEKFFPILEKNVSIKKEVKQNSNVFFQPAEKTASEQRHAPTYYSYAFAIAAIVGITSYAISKITSFSEQETNQYQP